MTILAQRLLPDALWQRIQPLLPPPPSRGVFERLQEVLLDELGEAGQLDWSRVSVDSFSLRAIRGDHVGANPVDRAKPGSKLHLAADGGGLPLSLLVTGANTNDSTMFEALLDDIPWCARQRAGGAVAPRRSTPTRPTTFAAAAATSPAGQQGPHRPLWGGVV